MLVNQTTEVVAVLVKVQNHKVLGLRVRHLPHVLVPRNFYHGAEFEFLGLFLDLRPPFGHILAHELIVKVEVVLHVFDFVEVFLFELVFESAFLFALLLGFELDFGEGFLFFLGDVVAVFDLKVEPLGVDSVRH